MPDNPFKARLRRRAQRLVEAIDNDAPAVMLGQEVLLVLKAGVGMCPFEVGAALTSWFSDTVRFEADVCKQPDCHLPSAYDDIYCAGHGAAVDEALDEEIEEHEREIAKNCPGGMFLQGVCCACGLPLPDHCTPGGDSLPPTEKN
jgi:hypothetical protein